MHDLLRHRNELFSAYWSTKVLLRADTELDRLAIVNTPLFAEFSGTEYCHTFSAHRSLTVENESKTSPTVSVMTQIQ